MESIRSRDNTSIAYEKSGQGAPLVLVHGTSADHTRWKPVLPPLEAKFTVYSVDRRGRGGSGDSQPYAIEREYEDIAALVDSIPEPVNLLGHSYGALCSLEAALRTKNLRRLILYEPPIPVEGMSFNFPRVMAEMQARLAAGDRDGVVTTFLHEIAEIPADELKMLRSLPAWQGRLAAAHTILRELQGPPEYRIQPERLQQIRIPTLLLLGGASPAYRKMVAEQLHAALPNSRIAVMPGQQHTAMNTAPELFIKEVLAFLT